MIDCMATLVLRVVCPSTIIQHLITLELYHPLSRLTGCKVIIIIIVIVIGAEGSGRVLGK